MLTLTGSDQLDAYTQKYAESNKNLYIYPWSKTIYRRTIHPNIPDSVYKKMYNLLKSNGYITAATGNYVTIKNQPITEDQFNSAFSDNEAINDKAIQNILANIQELSADNSYYMKMIGDLENKIHQLEVENNEIRNQLSNKHLTTWY
jgi:DNA-binding transcriptional regulator YhcF (GntR family)